MLTGRPHARLWHVLAVVACVSLLGGGTAVAARLITGKQVQNRSLTGLDIRKNSVGGVEVNEARLRKVPASARADSAGRADTAGSADRAVSAAVADRAATAAGADRVGGLAASRFDFFRAGGEGAGASFTQVLDFGGVRLSARCNGGMNLEHDLDVRANVPRGSLVEGPIRSGLSSGDSGRDLWDLTVEAAGVLAVRRPDGGIVTFQYLSHEDPASAIDPCAFSGTALYAPPG